MDICRQEGCDTPGYDRVFGLRWRSMLSTLIWSLSVYQHELPRQHMITHVRLLQAYKQTSPLMSNLIYLTQKEAAA